MLSLAEIFTLSFVIHLLLHLTVPALVAGIFYRQLFWRALWLMLAGMLIDLDHLLASPMVDPNRCSVGYHLLHQYWLLPLYLLLAWYPRTRLLGLGLVIHILLDAIDCWL